MTPITDPAILSQLEGGLQNGPVTDPAILSQLEAAPSPLHNLAVVGSGIVRGAPAIPLGIVDTTARIPTWAYNTATVDKLPYPPSLYGAYTDWANQNLNLATPQDTFEDYVDSTLKGVAAGPVGAAGALAARASQNIPASDQNLTVSGRDVGISPRDIVSNVSGLVGGGAISPKAMALSSEKFPASPQAYLAQKLMDQDVPVYTSDVLPDGYVRGAMQWLGNSPLSGQVGRREGQQAALNRAATANIGVPSDNLTTQTMHTAKTNAGAVFNDIGTNHNIPPQNVNSLFDALSDVQQRAKSYSSNAQDKINNELEYNFLPRLQDNGSISGGDYNSLRMDFNKMSMNNDSEISSAGGQMAKALNGTMMNSLPNGKAAQLADALSNYRGMHALEPAVKSNMGTGNVDAAKLQSGADRVYGNYEYNDPAPLSQLAQGAQLLDRPQNPALDVLRARYGGDVAGVTNAAKDLASALTFGIPYRMANPQLTPSDLNMTTSVMRIPHAQALANALRAQGVNSAVAGQ